MLSYLICGKYDLRVAILLIAILSSGCASNDGASYVVQDYAIKQSKSFVESTCIRDVANEIKTVFFGLRFSTNEPVVTGYYYCNGKNPAKDAGILINDRVISVRNCAVRNTNDILALFKETPLQTFPLIKIQRNGVDLIKGVKVIPFIYGTASADQNSRNCKSE